MTTPSDTLRNPDLRFDTLYAEGKQKLFNAIYDGDYSFNPELCTPEEAVTLLFIAYGDERSEERFRYEAAPRFPEKYKITPLFKILRQKEDSLTLHKINNLYKNDLHKDFVQARYCETLDRFSLTIREGERNPFLLHVLPLMGRLSCHLKNPKNAEALLYSLRYPNIIRVLDLSMKETTPASDIRCIPSLPHCRIIRLQNLALSYIACQPACTEFSLTDSSEETFFEGLPLCQKFSLMNCPATRFRPPLPDPNATVEIKNCPKFTDTPFALSPLQWLSDGRGFSKEDDIWESLDREKGTDPDYPAYVFRMKPENKDPRLFRLFGLFNDTFPIQGKNLINKLLKQTPAVSWFGGSDCEEIKKLLSPYFAFLGYRFHATNSPEDSSIYMSLPSPSLLRKRWTERREKDPSFRDIDLKIATSEGIASDQDFLRIYAENDLLISEGVEFMHDQLLHAPFILGMIKDSPEAFKNFRKNKERMISCGMRLVNDPQYKNIREDLLFGLSLFIDLLHTEDVILTPFQEESFFPDSDTESLPKAADTISSTLRRHRNCGKKNKYPKDHAFIVRFDKITPIWEKISEEINKP